MGKLGIGIWWIIGGPKIVKLKLESLIKQELFGLIWEKFALVRNSAYV